MMHLVPIPPTAIDETRHIWQSYVLAIAERARNDPAEMERMLHAGEAQAFIVWDEEAQKAQAFLGVRYVLGLERVGELIWLMGENRSAWVHLIRDLEVYLRDQQGCKRVRPTARQGWAKHLKSNGYRETHRVFEKEL